ncbi:unnamed protein product [Urochloa humidicola]
MSRERAERGERRVRGATGVAGTTHHRDDSLHAAASESREGEGTRIRRRRAPAAGAARGSGAAELPPLRARRGTGVQLWAAVRAPARSSGSPARFRRRQLCYWVQCA